MTGFAERHPEGTLTLSLTVLSWLDNQLVAAQSDIRYTRIYVASYSYEQSAVVVRAKACSS